MRLCVLRDGLGSNRVPWFWLFFYLSCEGMCDKVRDGCFDHVVEACFFPLSHLMVFIGIFLRGSYYIMYYIIIYYMVLFTVFSMRYIFVYFFF